MENNMHHCFYVFLHCWKELTFPRQSSNYGYSWTLLRLEYSSNASSVCLNILGEDLMPKGRTPNCSCTPLISNKVYFLCVGNIRMWKYACLIIVTRKLFFSTREILPWRAVIWNFCVLMNLFKFKLKNSKVQIELPVKFHLGMRKYIEYTPGYLSRMVLFL